MKIKLEQKNFLNGLSYFRDNSDFGMLYNADGYNPAIYGGALAFSSTPVSINPEVITDQIQAFTPYINNLYAIGTNGHFYKIETLNGTTTASDLRSVTPITSPQFGLETFDTLAGSYKIYYWNGTQIGQLDPSSDTFDDDFITGLHVNDVHCTFKRGTRVYFGDKNYVSYLSDNLSDANPVLVEDVVILPVEDSVRGLSHDGTYLVVATSEAAESKYETKLYFWNVDDNYTAASRIWTIPDRITSLKTIKGVSYALCTGGLWAFTFDTPPEKITNITTGVYGYFNTISEVGDAVFTGNNTKISSYGKLSPEFNTSITNPINSFAGSVTALYTQASNTRLFFGTAQSKLFYCDYKTQRNSVNDLIKTSYIDLGDYYKVYRVDVVFKNTLVAGDSIAIRARTTDGGIDGTDYTDMTTISYTSNGSVNQAISYTNTALLTDKISLELTFNGVPVIKNITIYGEPAER